MADIAHPDGDSNVVVTLVATGSTQAGIRERRITLTRMEPTAPVGRSSKVAAKACLAAENNAWFETPVMSREHAELTADFDKKTITLKDVGSLHGSFVRHRATPQTEERVPPNTSVQLARGDQIRFGMDIHRHQEKFPPCVVDFDSMWRNLPEGKKSPNTFSVPYGSDDEDPTSDTDSVMMMEQKLPPITKYSATTIDLASTGGNASPQHMGASRPRPSRIIDLTAEEPDVDSDVSMTGLYSPVPSSRRSLSTSPAAHTKPMPALAGSGTAEWTDIESEEDSVCSSQSSEDLENLPLLSDDDDDQSINSEDSARLAQMSEDTSDDSMSDSEMGSYDEDSDADSYEDDDEETHGYDWEATRTFGLPVGTVRDATVAPVEHISDGFAHDTVDIVTQSDKESVFNETPAFIWTMSNPTNEVQHMPYPQRQFSPSDAAMVKKHTPAVEGSGSSATTAQALGAKTGKFEYFEARDHNRCLAAHSSAPPAPALMSDYPNHGPMASLYLPGWSGTEFINQPPPAKQLESLEDRTRLQSPEPLDMTSAYTYQQSKSERRVTSPDVRRIPIPDLLTEESKEPSPAPNVDPSPPVISISKPVPQPVTRPPKRGVEEISGDVEDTPVMEPSPATISMPVQVSERYIEAQPTKRRRIVEFAACVTLGGAAVLAGLITTAPQFA
jgi:hypothetical protein